MLNDITTSIKASLYARVTSPLSGAFAISWIAWNHRLLFVLFSAKGYEEKFEFVDEVLYPSWVATVNHGLLLPLASATFLIFIYPLPARYVYEYASKQKKALKEIKQRIDDETPITREEAKELRMKHTQMELEHETELKRQDARVQALDAEIAKQTIELADQASELEARQEGIDMLKASLRTRDSEMEELEEKVKHGMSRIEVAADKVASTLRENQELKRGEGSSRSEPHTGGTESMRLERQILNELLYELPKSTRGKAFDVLKVILEQGGSRVPLSTIADWMAYDLDMADELVEEMRAASLVDLESDETGDHLISIRPRAARAIEAVGELDNGA